ncbi:MAG: hypothetical protein ABSB86_00815 [Bryobacteraceae bacterium]
MRPPRLARLVAPAHKLEAQVRSGRVKIWRAGACQSEHQTPLPERELRDIARWDRQQALFERMLAVRMG